LLSFDFVRFTFIP